MRETTILEKTSPERSLGVSASDITDDNVTNRLSTQIAIGTRRLHVDHETSHLETESTAHVLQALFKFISSLVHDKRYNYYRSS